MLDAILPYYAVYALCTTAFFLVWHLRLSNQANNMRCARKPTRGEILAHLTSLSNPDEEALISSVFRGDTSTEQVRDIIKPPRTEECELFRRSSQKLTQCFCAVWIPGAVLMLAKLFTILF